MPQDYYLDAIKNINIKYDGSISLKNDNNKGLIITTKIWN